MTVIFPVLFIDSVSERDTLCYLSRIFDNNVLVSHSIRVVSWKSVHVDECRSNQFRLHLKTLFSVQDSLHVDDVVSILFRMNERTRKIKWVWESVYEHWSLDQLNSFFSFVNMRIDVIEPPGEWITTFYSVPHISCVGNIK